MATNKKPRKIVALRNENGSYNRTLWLKHQVAIVALRNENGRYNQPLR